MQSDDVDNALSRIDAALARIETAAMRPSGADAGLAARHDHLRGAVSRTLRQLDALIGEQERGR